MGISKIPGNKGTRFNTRVCFLSMLEFYLSIGEFNFSMFTHCGPFKLTSEASKSDKTGEQPLKYWKMEMLFCFF